MICSQLLALPDTLALAENDIETLADAVKAAERLVAKSAPYFTAHPTSAVNAVATPAALAPMSATEVPANWACAAISNSAGRFASRVVCTLAAAVPVIVTLTAGGVQVAVREAEPLQPALQSAAASQAGGVTATSHFGAVYATEHPPEHVPLQEAVAPAAALHSPLQPALQVPLHATPFPVVPVCPLQVPSQVPLQVPLQVRAAVTLGRAASAAGSRALSA